ncbi:hypothetical protein NDU88_005959 [Pleurodeles waltl]|uniref:Uncharacterized protein n=1 Tax=Pleurodeles waltl TaxID=8319 RepID=A0AAV7UK42_PLEWA|nr:hypothetical protein NDU88_005959 [Pleurodeles waltl]
MGWTEHKNNIVAENSAYILKRPQRRRDASREARQRAPEMQRRRRRMRAHRRGAEEPSLPQEELEHPTGICRAAPAAREAPRRRPVRIPAMLWGKRGLSRCVATLRGDSKLRRPPSGNRQKTVPRSKDRGGHSGFPTGLAGDCRKSARQPSGKHPSHEDAGSEWSRRSGKVRRVQLHPSRISVSAKQTLKFFVGPSYRGPCSAHAIGMGTAGAPRGPTAPHTAILFPAGEPPGTGWRYAVSESPWRRSKLRRHGGFPWAAESRRYTAGFPLLAAAVPPRSECPAVHRQPVGGATANLRPGGNYRQGQNDPLNVNKDFISYALSVPPLITFVIKQTFPCNLSLNFSPCA